MKIVFDIEAVNERGTTIAALDYAKFGRDILNFEPIIIYNRDLENNRAVLRGISQCFPIADYDNFQSKCLLVRELGTDVYYKLKTSYEDLGVVPGPLNLVHCVFDFDRPHGDVYAYVSEWLSVHTSSGLMPFVPHIVQLPASAQDMRSAWGISPGQVIVGRHGGKDQFNVDFVKTAVGRCVEARQDIVFVFVNTRKFIDHSRVIFLPPIIDVQEKADFISSCDIMLHARYGGESFGLAMAEFLFFGKPVLCWAGGWDRNHLSLQPNKSLVYRSGSDVMRLLMSLTRESCRALAAAPLRAFSPENVISMFDNVFLRPSEPSHVVSSRRGIKRRLINRFNRVYWPVRSAI